MQSEKDIQRAIGKRIQKIRKEKGYTQQQFAEIIGVQNAVADYRPYKGLLINL